MRLWFLTFLMAVIALPSLACAMPICASSGLENGQENQAHISMPCHQDANNNGANMTMDGQVMLMKDCMNIDLSAGDLDRSTVLQISQKSVDYPCDMSCDLASLGGLNHINALSFDPHRAQISNASAMDVSTPPLYMATSRLRL